MRKLPEFDDLIKMSKEELETLREKYVEEVINSAGSEEQKRKLRGLQFQIDMQRRKSKNPMDSCIKISKMMHDKFLELRDALKELNDSNIKVKNGKLVEPSEIQNPPSVDTKLTSSFNNVIKINKRLQELDNNE